MGAEVFHTKSRGDDALQAFEFAVEDAYYTYGHQGYTGSIAEKSGFTIIDLPKGQDPYEYAEKLIDKCDPRIDSKWGPAGCFNLGKGEFYFFGWASC